MAPATLTRPAQPTLPTQPPAVETPVPSGTPSPVDVPTNTAPPLPSPLPATPTSALVGITDASAYTWRPVVNGLAKPDGLVNAGDGSGRLFITEQAGRIRIVQDGNLLPQPFLDLTSKIGSAGLEQGLLGLAFHPDYAQNGFFYVDYTDLQGNTVVARFQVSQIDPNLAQPDSEQVILRVNQPYPNHNGGEIQFGPDGYLYIGLGDGGSAGDPAGNGQSLDTLLAKILRLDVDHGDPYAIPPDNPFAAGGGLPEIFAYGLRNPWRFSFDSKTGDLYIGDVGQSAWEEIDYLPADVVAQTGSRQAVNFGWKYYEGNHPYAGSPPAGLQLTAPIVEYSHQYGCSVTGGVVYRGSQLPAWQGVYLFSDWCLGRVWGTWRDASGTWQLQTLFENMGNVTSFGVDEQGEVYLVDQSGIIYQLSAK